MPDVAKKQKLEDVKKEPRVLCCGDSLTAGYYGSDIKYCPYAKKLSEKLGVPVDEIGMSGWRTDEMVANMNSEKCTDVFEKEACGLLVQLAKHDYSVCIIMGGTNDLAVDRTADEILQDIQTLHGACHERGLRTVALPIPESFCLVSSYGSEPADEWEDFNERLEQWAKTMPDKMLFVDMASRVPFSMESEYWAKDGLHMSRRGYIHFGEVLSDLIRDFVLGSEKKEVTEE